MSYNWTTPDLGQTRENQIRIRVSNNTRNVSDTSAAFRVYTEPSVAIIARLDGEFVGLGSAKAINWDNGDFGSSDTSDISFYG